MPAKPKCKAKAAAAASGEAQQQQQQQQQQPAPTKAQAAKAAAAEEEQEEMFEQNENVLALDSGELYDAKVLRVSEAKAAGAAGSSSSSSSRRQYFIHYQGWNAKWDKWVDASLLRKINAETRQLQKQLKEMKAAAKKKGGSGGSSASSSVASGGGNHGGEGGESVAPGAGGSVASSKGRKGGKAGSDAGSVGPPPDPDIVEDSGADPQVKLAMPFTLKKQLVDDWEKVTRDPSQLVPLPRTPSVATVLQQFLQAKQEKEGTSALQLRRYQELLEGLRLYFDKALPLTLLYRQERQQYDRLKALMLGGGNGGKGEASSASSFRPSDVYGPEHLLRLFVRLPHLLARAPMTAQEATQVQAKLGDFLKFLQRQHQDLFLQVYTRAGEDCINLPAPSSTNPPEQNEEGQGEEGAPTPMDVDNDAAPAPAVAVEAGAGAGDGGSN